MILQRKLLRVLTLVYSPKPCVCGFVKGKNIIANAAPHVRSRHLLNFDLEDFFPSIHIGRVEGTLRAPPFSLGFRAARVIAQVVCHSDGHLPQGAPTSPIIANLVCGPFDTEMTQFAKKHRLTYTRYADDLTFSTTRGQFPVDAVVDDAGVVSIGSELADIVSRHRFTIRDGKTRLRSNSRRQSVTGLVVNEFVNTPRRFSRELRAIIHRARVDGLHAAAVKHAACSKVAVPADSKTWICNVIRGKLSYLAMVRGLDDCVVRRYSEEAAEVGVNVAAPRPLSQIDPQPIRGRHRAEVDWRKWAQAYEDSVFRLRCVSEYSGKEEFGTAFVLGNERIVTAGHNHIEKLATGAESLRSLYIENENSEVPVSFIKSDHVAGKQDLAYGMPKWAKAGVRVAIRTQFRVPEVGEQVAALGFPKVPWRRSALVLHTGVVESVAVSFVGGRFVTVSFASGPGLSGAPLIDANGCCIGVMVENTFQEIAGAPSRPYGQAILLGHLKELG